MAYMEDKSDRPLLIAFIGFIYGMIAMAWIAMGLTILIMGETAIDDIVSQYPDMSIIQGLGMAIAGICLILGIVYVLLCAGFLRGWSPIWYIGVIFTVLSTIGGVATFIVSPLFAAIGIVVDLAILFYLFKPNVKRFFIG